MEINTLLERLEEAVFVDNAKVMSKGQITIPKDVRDVLGVGTGDRVTFIVNNGEVKVVNSAVYAMRVLQEKMVGEAEKTVSRMNKMWSI